MRTVKRFEAFSVMKIAAVCYAVLGLLEGALCSVVFSAMPLASEAKMPPFFSFMLGGFAIVFFPVCFAVVGAIFGGLGALIYNLGARFVGGIQVEME